MPSDDTKEFVEERLLAYDPDIDLTSGSPAQEQVVDPIVRRYQPDPLEMDVELFIETQLQQEYPDLNVREGSGLRDGLVKPCVVLLDPVTREMKILKQNQSLAAPELLAPSDADSLVANMFVSRSVGDLAAGTVRLYFNAPQAVSITTGNVCYTASGLRFIPTSLQNISAETMVFNQSGSLYYFDIQVTAEKVGDDYNIDKEEIIGITNLNNAVQVTNLSAFEDGLDEETTDALVTKAEESITERSLVTARGATAHLLAEFSNLRHLQVVGFTDEEMERDIITGGDLGPVVAYGNDGFTEDDGDGDGYTQALTSRQEDFTALFGALGSVEDQAYYLIYSETNYGTNGEVPGGNLNQFVIPDFDFTDDDEENSILITFGATNPANNGIAKILEVITVTDVLLDRVGVAESGISWIFIRRSQELEILEVLSSETIKVDGDIPINKPAIAWEIRQKKLTLSDLPGGIVTEADREALEIAPNEIHIGGCTDFYVRSTTPEKKTLVLSSIADEAPAVGPIFSLNTDATAGKEEFVWDTSKDFVALGIKPGWSLVIETGVDAGSYTIISVGIDPTGAEDENYLQIDTDMTSTASNLRYRIIDDIDIDLRQPKTPRGEGDDLRTIQLSDIVTTASATDFGSLGTEVGDTLRIKSGPDVGDHSIEAIQGTGDRELQVGDTMTGTNDNLSYEVFKEQEGIDFPLIRITGVALLDSSNQPTGDEIPYAEPVDARGTAFSNAGRGTKVSTTDAIFGIVGSVDLDGLSYPLGATVIRVIVNMGSGIDITLTGVTSKSNLIDTINAAVPNIAGTLDVDGESRLTLRSKDRWIMVTAKADNANVGLDTVGEDNRQIKSAGNISDWQAAAYDLVVQKDSVWITTGDNIGFYHLVSIPTSDRLLVVGFDEDDGEVRFLMPETRGHVAVGSRSYGVVRVYFLDPTSFQVRGNWWPALKNTDDHPANKAIGAGFGTDVPVDEDERTVFTAEINGVSLRFFPDPDLDYEVIPVSDGDPPNNLVSTSGSAVLISESTPTVDDLGVNSRDSEVDFLKSEIKVGDLIDITWQPIQGDNDMSGLTLPGDLQDKTLILSVDGAPPKTMVFSDQLSDVDDIIDEVNEAFGETIAYKETLTSPAKELFRLEADYEIILHKNSTAIYDGGALLWTAAQTSNLSNKSTVNIDGYYRVTDVAVPNPTDHNYIQVDQNLGDTAQAHHFRVLREGTQRIISTDMNDNTELGLYYVDIELVSEGPGDDWNVPQDQLFTLEGYLSDGYRLVVQDKNRSFSEEEELTMTVSRRIVQVGQTDDPTQMQNLYNQNIQISYERSPLTESVQSFASADIERVLNASILVRHLQPHFINFEMNYRGGSSDSVVGQDVDDHIDNLTPDDRLEVSDLQDLPLRRGASYVENPITLVAVVHDEERKITVERSQDYVTHGRLATFFPDDITISREAEQSL